MKKFSIVFAVMAVFVLAFSSAFAAAGDTTRNTADLSKYEAPEYATPVVDPTTGDTVLTVTNTYYPELVDVSVSKIWDDDDNRDNFRPESICITLTAAANGGATQEEVWNYTLSASDVNANDDNRWDHTFENLVKFYDGYQIAYTVAEESGNCSAQVEKTQANCEISGGKWENNACTPFSLFAPTSGGNTPSVDYSSLTSQAECEAADPAGVWHAGVCSDESLTDQQACEGASETWTPAFCAAN
ncbi:MAG: Cna B-type domain-containing protein [Anaerolineaceae bacterium]|nr:Cna B-type domain-containing protein [Anaerolineaceae bacterium]